MPASINEFLILSLLAACFGATQKLADAHHEHGLSLFPHAAILFGVLCGAVGAYLISFSSILQATYLGPLIYWFYKRKIDCPQHIIAATIKLCAVAASIGKFEFPWLATIGIFAGYASTDLLKHCACIQRMPLLSAFFRFRLHFHAIHGIYSFLSMSFYPSTALAFNLIGIALAERLAKIPSHPVATPSPNERA